MGGRTSTRAAGGGKTAARKATGKEGRTIGMDGKQVLKFAKDKKAVCVDVRFCDFFGSWQHFTVPMTELNEGVFSEGFGFDGSSIRGWQVINASDMLVIPDPSTAVMDPFTQHPTLVLIGNVVDPITKEEYSRDPRNVALKAEAYLKGRASATPPTSAPSPSSSSSTTSATTATSTPAYYLIDSNEAIWNSGRDEEPNLGYKIRHKEGYVPCPPSDQQQDIRQEMVLTMEQVGIQVERQHHEVATAGQAEIDMRFDSLSRWATS
jgi:glutamine synthetase